MITVLRSGIDTAELSFPGRLAAPWADWLEEAKTEAQLRDEPQSILLAGWPYAVQHHGQNGYPYLLTAEDLHLRVGSGNGRPMLFARMLSLGLLAHGFEALYAALSKQAGLLGGRDGTLSRLDLYADFQGWFPTVEEMRGMVCAARFRPVYPNLEHPETFQLGRGAVVVRIYDKTAEIRASGKGYWEHVWRQHPGYRPGERVTRVEVQLRREVLRELSCTDPAAALASLRGIFAFGLSWASLRLPAGKSSDRWPPHPAWEELGERAGFEGGPVQRVKEASYVGGTARLIPMAAGILVSIAARLGIADYEVALGVVEKRLAAHFEDAAPFDQQVGKRMLKMEGNGREMLRG